MTTPTEAANIQPQTNAGPSATLFARLLEEVSRGGAQSHEWSRKRSIASSKSASHSRSISVWDASSTVAQDARDKLRAYDEARLKVTTTQDATGEYPTLASPPLKGRHSSYAHIAQVPTGISIWRAPSPPPPVEESYELYESSTCCTPTARWDDKGDVSPTSHSPPPPPSERASKRPRLNHDMSQHSNEINTAWPRSSWGFVHDGGHQSSPHTFHFPTTKEIAISAQNSISASRRASVTSGPCSLNAETVPLSIPKPPTADESSVAARSLNDNTTGASAPWNTSSRSVSNSSNCNAPSTPAQNHPYSPDASTPFSSPGHSSTPAWMQPLHLVDSDVSLYMNRHSEASRYHPLCLECFRRHGDLNAVVRGYCSVCGKREVLEAHWWEDPPY